MRRLSPSIGNLLGTVLAASIGVARTIAPLKRLMRGTFGLAEFRPGQEAVIRSIVGGHDTVAVMPTGAGKSLR